MEKNRVMREAAKERMGQARKLSGWAIALPVDLEAANLGERGPAPTRMLALGERETLESPGASLAFAEIWGDPSESWGGGEKRAKRGGRVWIGDTQDVAEVWKRAIEVWRDIGEEPWDQAAKAWRLEREGSDSSPWVTGFWMTLSAFDLGKGRSLLALHASPRVRGALADKIGNEWGGDEPLAMASFGRLGGVYPPLGDTLALEAIAKLDERRDGEGAPKELRALVDFDRVFGLGDRNKMFARLSPDERWQVLAEIDRALAVAQGEELAGAAHSPRESGKAPPRRL